MAITDPRDIPGLKFWGSAQHEAANYADGAVMTGGWTDLSGNGNHGVLTGAVGAYRPTWRSSGGPGGGAYIQFNGFGGPGSGFSLPSGIMAGAVAGEIAASIYASTNNDGLWLFGTSGASSHYMYGGAIYDDFGTTARKTVGSNTASTWQRYAVRSKAGTWTAWLNGTEKFTTGSNTVGWQTVPTIGYGLGQAFSGRMGAVVLYNRELTTTERSDLDAWLAANPSGGTAATTPSVSATASGSGTLSTTVVEVETATAAGSGSGTLATAVAAVAFAAAAATGSGTLTAAVEVVSAIPQRTASASGSGTLVAAVAEVEFATADASGSGTLTAAVELVTPPGDGIDLSTFVNLYDSTTLDGGHLVVTTVDPMFFTFASQLDPATTYTVAIDFIDAVGNSKIALYSSLGPTEVDADASAWESLAYFSEGFGTTPPGTIGATGPFTFDIGPGIESWDAAVTAGEHFVIFELANMEVTGITVAAEVVEPPAPDGETDDDNDAYALTFDGWATAEWEPAIVLAPFASVRHSVISAIAYGPVTMQGTRPVFTYSEADRPRLRQRILLGSRDVTYDRGVPTPDVDYQLADLLLYGPGTLELPAVSAAWETGTDASDLWAEARRVKVQLVDDFTDPETPTVEATIYKGFVLDPRVSGRHLTLELGGEASGRLALRDSKVLFREVLDISRLLWRELTDVGVRYLPRLGLPEPTHWSVRAPGGIKTLNFGGIGKLEKVEELIARATKKDGTQCAVLPDDEGVYRIGEKDTTTAHFSVFVDDAFTVADLSSDIAEKPNTVYATAIDPRGMRIDGAAVPGLISTPAPDYPNGATPFGEGSTNEDTASGDGVSIMVNRLGAVGLLDIRDTPGGYDEDVADAVKKVQRRAGLFVSGDMNPATWRALWDLDVTGRSGQWSSIQPTAQDSSVQRYLRSASGAPIGLNPDFDADAIEVDESIDMGTGFRERQVENWAEARVHAPGAKVWYGTITVNLGAVLVGQVNVGDTITSADLVDARLVQPGRHNLWIPNFDGGTLFGVSGVQVNGESVVFTVDTRHRPAREVWERIQVRRETRNDPARRMLGTRQSTQQKDAVRGFISWGGIIDRDVPLEPGWNVVEVVVGDHGTLSWIETVVQSIGGSGGEVAIEGREYALALFGKPITAARLNALVPAPLTVEGEKAWRRRATRKELKKTHGMIVAFGTEAEPCGYDEDLKSDGAPLTGRFFDDAGETYDVEGYVARLCIYVRGGVTDAKLLKGRVLWPVLEGGV